MREELRLQLSGIGRTYKLGVESNGKYMFFIYDSETILSETIVKTVGFVRKHIRKESKSV